MELYAGIDLHSNNSVVTVLDEKDRTVYARRLPNNLDAIVSALRACAGSVRGVAVESTYNWYWLVDGLQAAGFTVHLVNTAAVKQYDGLKLGGDFSDLIHEHLRTVSKRLRATKDYINAIFKNCKRQLSVRVDLGYKNIPSPDGQGTVRSSLSLAKVGRHRERLEKAMGRAWGSSLSGFVMRLEWGPHKTFHFHLILLLNGHHVQGRTYNAKKVGRMWERATDGVGNHWEPTAHEGDTRDTGEIDGNKPEELAAVIKTAAYLCKEGHYIDYYKGEKEKTFFRGEVG